MTAIGIDPGKDGGIVVLGSSGAIIRSFRMPVIQANGKREYDMIGLRDQIKSLDAYDRVHVVAAVEFSQPMPSRAKGRGVESEARSMGAKSAYSQGMGQGLVFGLMVGLGIKTIRVTPQQWHRWIAENGAGAVYPEPKIRAREYASMRWGLDQFIPKGCRVPHQGLIDAACIAAWVNVHG
jgi:hypothetical protein